MTRKIAFAAFAAALAVAPMLTTAAEAKDGRRTAAAFGIAAGIGGVLLGAALANSQPRYQADYRYQAEPRYQARPRHYSYGVQTVGAYGDEEECVRRPIHRVDRFTGEIITVGSKLVCR